MPCGTPGGDVSGAGHAAALLNRIAFGMDPQAAIEAPLCDLELSRLFRDSPCSLAG